jgi:hypothetical protein
VLPSTHNSRPHMARMQWLPQKPKLRNCSLKYVALPVSGVLIAAAQGHAECTAHMECAANDSQAGHIADSQAPPRVKCCTPKRCMCQYTKKSRLVCTAFASSTHRKEKTQVPDHKLQSFCCLDPIIITLAILPSSPQCWQR